MPYMVMHEGDNWDVYKKGPDGKPEGNRLGRHPSKEKADAQMAAIHANEKTLGEGALAASAKFWDDDMPMMPMPAKLEPTDTRVQYNPLGGNGTEACANCQWFCAHAASCNLVWDDIVATGKCNLWLQKPGPYQPTPMPVVIVADETAEKKPDPAPAGITGNLKQWLLDFFVKQAAGPAVETGFKVLPDNKWVAFFTNNLQDLTKEIFAASAHDLLISWLDKGLVPYPELWWYHIPGTRHGQCTWMGRQGHIVIAAGTFDDTPLAQEFKKEYERHPQKVSHGFVFPTAAKQHGVYYAYIPYELSPLPLGSEANPITGFLSGGKEVIPEAKISQLRAFLTPERVSEILAKADELSKQADQQGIASKQVEAVPVVDQGARDAIQALTKDLTTTLGTAIKEALAPVSTQLAEQTKAIQAIQTAETALTGRMTALETWVKEQFAAGPRASQAPGTVVPPSDPAAAELAARAKDPNAGSKENEDFGQVLAGKFMPPAGA